MKNLPPDHAPPPATDAGTHRPRASAFTEILKAMSAVQGAASPPPSPLAFDAAEHAMLDLETLGRGPDAAIVAIGAVQFDPFAGTLGDTVYLPVSLASSVAAGGNIDPETVVWWLGQPDPARAAIASAAAEGRPLPDALRDFAAWLPANVRLWGNGAAFDNAVLANAYRRAGMEQPWHYRNDRCYRTVAALFPSIAVDPPGDGEVAHQAQDDAVAQARHLLKIAATLGLTRPSDSGSGGAAGGNSAVTEF